MPDPTLPYVSRGGLKLAAALEAFGLNVKEKICADLGCNVGGFTDCLLQRGAVHVFAVDTAYGELAWKLRQDPRVTVLERTNALHTEPASVPAWQALPTGGVDCVVIDLGWTRQQRAIPAALKWLTRHADGRVITLIKPHYEADWQGEARKERRVLSDDEAATITQRVLSEMPTLGVRVLGHILSPIRGGGSRSKEGNVEYLALLARATESDGIKDNNRSDGHNRPESHNRPDGHNRP